MTSRFETCLDRILTHEGGYVNHPRDPGGATNYGVTQVVYNDYRARNSFPPQSVRYITKLEVSAIYRAGYWDKVRADELPIGVDYVVFDGAVNSGPRRSVKWLQAVVDVDQDGVVGPATLAAVKAENPREIVNDICDVRFTFLRRLDTWSTFGRGWTRRVNKVRAGALDDVVAAPKPPVVVPVTWWDSLTGAWSRLFAGWFR